MSFFILEERFCVLAICRSVHANSIGAANFSTHFCKDLFYFEARAVISFLRGCPF